jgi:adenylate kinase
MDGKIARIREWLGAGSVNIFGLPMSGKDTVGIRLAEALGGRFLSSGIILREEERVDKALRVMDEGEMAPTDIFEQVVLPYFAREDLIGLPLVLSSVGRWSGEEGVVMGVARTSGHEVKAAMLLNISEEDVWVRWEAAKIAGDRGERFDDKDRVVFRRRIKEFQEKTMPVVKAYLSLGLLINVKANGNKDAVFSEVVHRLYDFAVGIGAGAG